MEGEGEGCEDGGEEGRGLRDVRDGVREDEAEDSGGEGGAAESCVSWGGGVRGGEARTALGRSG